MAYKDIVGQQNYVAHALGGIDGFKYTNSREALEQSYNNGFKLFEVDVKLTSDRKAVCVHGWAQKDYKERLGMEYNEENPIMDYSTFMNVKVQGKYTTLSFKDLANFMKQHNDMYVIIDIGCKSYEETKEIYTKIVQDCEYDDMLLQRLIVGGHTTDMIRAVKDCYNFNLINLYWATDEKREDVVKSKENFVKFCKNNSVNSLSIAKKRFSSEFGEFMRTNGLAVYVFTENDDSLACELLQHADFVGTDFLLNR